MMKKTKLTRRVALGTFTAIGVSVLAAWFSGRFEYARAGSIERIEIDTRSKLEEYERTGNAEPLRAWIMSQDGAFSTAAMYTLGDWAIRHEELFLVFLDSIYATDATQGTKFVEGFGSILADAGLDDEFRQAFRGHRSERLSLVFRAIPKSEPW